MKQKEYKRAQRRLKKVITMDDKDVGALWSYGNAVYLDKEPLTKAISDDAIDALIKVMNLDKSLSDLAEKKIMAIARRVEQGL